MQKGGRHAMKRSTLLVSILGFLYLISAQPVSADVKIKNPASVSVEDTTTFGLDTSQCIPVTPDEDGSVSVPEKNANVPLVHIAKKEQTGGSVLQGTDTYGNNVSVYSCPQTAFEKILQDASALGVFEKIFVGIAFVIFNVLDFFTTMLTVLMGEIFMKMISQGTFVNDGLVKEGWPFVQGIANLGFIFALLYIALATTLRIESVSTSIQRLLPKLLIGALLVNFSLIIGGLLIDTSRLLVALEISLLAEEGVTKDNFASRIIQKTQLPELELFTIWGFKPSEGTQTSEANNIWSLIMRRAMASFFIMALAVALAIISVNLLVRYVALLVLLILSPIPYLALALPQANQIFKDWWKHFLQWVFYAPVVVFFLVVLTRIQTTAIIDAPANAQPGEASFTKTLIHFLVVITFFILAHVAGKKAAGVGSDAVMGWAKNNPRKALVGMSALTGVGLLPALGAIAGVGAARYTGSAAANAGRDFKDKFSKDFGKRTRSDERYFGIPGSGVVTKFLAGPERDENGKLKKGQDSIGSLTAKGIGKRIGLGDPNERKEASAIKENLSRYPLAFYPPDPAAPSGALDVPASLQPYINGGGLSQGHIAKALGKQNIEMIVKHTTNKGDLGGLAQNEDYLRELGGDGRSELIRNIGTNMNLSPQDKSDIVNRIVRTAKEKDL